MDDALKHCAELKALFRPGDVLRERILLSIATIDDRLHAVSGPA